MFNNLRLFLHGRRLMTLAITLHWQTFYSKQADLIFWKTTPKQVMLPICCIKKKTWLHLRQGILFRMLRALCLIILAVTVIFG